MNIRSRLTLTFSVAVFLGVAIYSATLFYFYRSDLYANLDKLLRSDAETVEMALERHLGVGNEGRTTAPSLLDVEADSANWISEVWTHAGERVYFSGSSDEFPLGAIDGECVDEKRPESAFTLEGGIRVHCARSEAYPSEFTIRVARRIEKTAAQLRRFLLLMALGVPIVALLSALAGSFIARRALRPMTEITESARRISAENLSERLEVNDSRDEIGRLAITFNEMFARLETSFSRMQAFTADAAHELRTPLSSIRTMGEVALRKELDVESYRRVISDVLEETARLHRLCEGLLTLAKADSHELQFKREAIEVKPFVDKILDFVGVLAEEGGVEIRNAAGEGLRVFVDPLWFKQVLVNVIDNAIKFSPGSSIAISAEIIGRDVVVSVKDRGKGIPAESLPHLFDRFYRADHGRHRSVGGSGLGLAIAKGIVEAHGGSITVTSEIGIGTEVSIRIPGEKEI
ncbi:MAG: heavy metal sensor histidine kinase [Bdellovibrionota bacterium]